MRLHKFIPKDMVDIYWWKSISKAGTGNALKGFITTTLAKKTQTNSQTNKAPVFTHKFSFLYIHITLNSLFEPVHQAMYFIMCEILSLPSLFVSELSSSEKSTKIYFNFSISFLAV